MASSMAWLTLMPKFWHSKDTWLAKATATSREAFSINLTNSAVRASVVSSLPLTNRL